jgi:hypothetical protein
MTFALLFHSFLLPRLGGPERSKVHALQMIIKQSAFWEHAPHQTWLTDTTLLRFLIAVGAGSQVGARKRRGGGGGKEEEEEKKEERGGRSGNS